MLLPLLYLFAVAGLTDAYSQLIIQNNTQVNSSSCPITYYEQEYTTFYTNFTGEHLFICFNGYYTPESNGDCIRIPNTINQTNFVLYDENNPQYWTFVTELIHGVVSTVTNSATCYMRFFGRSGGVALFGMGSQSVLYVSVSSSEDTVVLVNGHVVEKVSSPAHGFSFSDSSGCRISGLGVKPGTTHQSLDTCTSLTCSNTKIASMKTCPTGQCDSNGTCLGKGLCTVTGPTVIDFSEQLSSVSDRCEYTLLNDTSTGFTLKANFLERRRRDVSFVDSVTLDFSQGDDIQLQQGHRVLVGDKHLTYFNSVQVPIGVAITTDKTGVSVDVSLNGSSVSVFFDGTTAQVHVDLPDNQTYEGLCVNSSSFSSSRLSNDPSCQEQYEDPADDTIDSAAVTKQCDVLKKAPFSSCNSKVDPEPYMAACRQTLVKYPSVDNLRCQFLEAYAKACKKSDVNIQKWWTAAQCHHPEPICQDKCSDHEFCGDIHGNTDCRCRAIYAHDYTEQHRLGGPTVCNDNTATLTLVGCLLKENAINYTHLHLNDKTCTGVMDPESHMLQFTFTSDSCGTEVTNNNSQVIFTNAIVTRNSSSDLITRQDKVFIEFSCSHPKPDVQNVAFKILDNSIEIVLQSGEWTYSLTMKAYSDAAHTKLLDSNSEVRLNQKVWIVLETNGLDEDVVSVVTDSCWATSEDSASSTPRYDLIKHGCANAEDGTVNVMGNGEGTSNSFSFNMFEFSGKEPSEIYIHCQLQLCVKKNNNCVPVCPSGSRRRRSLRYRRGAPALISMVWTP